jgi:hypothetical protein
LVLGSSDCGSTWISLGLFGLVSTTHDDHLRAGATEIVSRYELDDNFPGSDPVALVQDAASRDEAIKADWHKVLSNAPARV